MIIQLIYMSHPAGFDPAMVEAMLEESRRHNRRDGVTGALICHAHLFLQFLEGPREVVTATFSRILRDERHVDVGLIWCTDATDRLFPDWDMRHDTSGSWLWTREAVRAGAMADVTAEIAQALFRRIAAEA